MRDLTSVIYEHDNKQLQKNSHYLASHTIIQKKVCWESYLKLYVLVILINSIDKQLASVPHCCYLLVLSLLDTILQENLSTYYKFYKQKEV